MPVMLRKRSFSIKGRTVITELNTCSISNWFLRLTFFSLFFEILEYAENKLIATFSIPLVVAAVWQSSWSQFDHKNYVVRLDEEASIISITIFIDISKRSIHVQNTQNTNISIPLRWIFETIPFSIWNKRKLIRRAIRSLSYLSPESQFSMPSLFDFHSKRE